jgi:hypothetical protein
MHIGYWWESQLGRPRRRWVNNIEMDLREKEWDGMDWTDLAQHKDQWSALVNTVMNLRVPQNIGNFLSSPCLANCFVFSGTISHYYITAIEKCCRET